MFSRMSVVTVYYAGYNVKFVTNLGGKDGNNRQKIKSNRKLAFDKIVCEEERPRDRKIDCRSMGSQA